MAKIKKNFLKSALFSGLMLSLVFGQTLIAWGEPNDASPEEESPILLGTEIPEEISYVPDEILIKVKDGVDIKKISDDEDISLDKFSRIKDIKPLVKERKENFDKYYKIKRVFSPTQWGAFLFKGKSYNELSEIPDDVIFEDIYKEFSKNKKDIYRTYKIKLSGDSTIEEMISQLQDNPDVEYAEPDYIYEADFTPNDPKFPLQSAHLVTQAKDGWDIEKGNEQVAIAIVDSGVSYDHVDLVNNIWANTDEIASNGIDDDQNGYIDDNIGWDFVDVDTSLCGDVDCQTPDKDPMDDYGHGTHCAGIAAAVTNNSIGVAGVCHNCKIMPVRVMYKKTTGGASGYSSQVASGIIYAAENGADIISLSLGSTSPNSIMEDAVNYAHSLGAVVIAAAGNYGTSDYHYPAAFDNVIAVGASSNLDKIASFSNYGDWVDFMAPGLSIYSTYLGNSYVFMSGTSMATPYAAGLAGLILSKNSNWTNEEVRSTLVAAGDKVVTDPLGSLYSRVNVFKSLQILNPLIVKIESPVAKTFDNPIEIYGTVSGQISSYTVDYGVGNNPSDFTEIAQGTSQKHSEMLATFTPSEFGPYTIRIRAYNIDNMLFEKKATIEYIPAPPSLMPGWPQTIGQGSGSVYVSSPTIADLNGDGYKEILIQTFPCQVYALDYLGNSLPGWPQNSSGNKYCQSTPAVGDVDGNGNPEIFVKSGILNNNWASMKLLGWNNDGSSINNWPLDIGSSSYKASVSLGDIDNDGVLDIIHEGNVSEIAVREPTTSYLPGWPQANSSAVTSRFGDIDNDGYLEIIGLKSSPKDLYVYEHTGELKFQNRINEVGLNNWDMAIGDVNGDDNLEIIASYSAKVNDVSVGQVTIADGNGEVLPGWPKTYEWNQTGFVYSYLSLGNLDDDDMPEIVVVNGHNLYVYNYDGSLLPGWPQLIDQDNQAYGQAVIGDINNDGENEILVTTKTGLYGFNSDGSSLYLEGFPVAFDEITGTGAQAKTPAIADIDNDGDVDIVVAVSNGYFEPVYVYTFDLPYAYNQLSMEWPMDQHDPQNSGLYKKMDIELLPDLVSPTDGISINPQYPQVGDNVDITAIVNNIGEADADNVAVQAQVRLNSDPGAPLLYNKIITKSIAQGESTEYIFTDWNTTGIDPDQYSVTIEIDPENTIEEINEGNNTSTKVVVIETQQDLPDVTGPGSAIYYTPLAPQPGDQINVKLTLVNIGLGDVSNVPISYSIYPRPDINNKLLTNETTIDSMSSGETIRLEFQWNTSGVEPGEYVIRVAIDPDNIINEEREFNNVLARVVLLGVQKGELPIIDSMTMTPQVNVPLKVELKATAHDNDGTVLRYFWDMGDGAIRSGANTWHTYAQGGTYQVILTAEDNDYDISLPKIQEITVTPLPANQIPIIDSMTMTPQVNVPLKVKLEATAHDNDGLIIRYYWDMGDGTTRTGGITWHTYLQGGTYPVTLTVEDNKHEFSIPEVKKITVAPLP